MKKEDKGCTEIEIELKALLQINSKLEDVA